MQERKAILLNVLRALYEDTKEMTEKHDGVWDTPSLAHKRGITKEEWRKTFDMYIRRYSDAKAEFNRIYDGNEATKIFGEQENMPCPSYSGLTVFINTQMAFVEQEFQDEEIEQLRRENKELRAQLESIKRLR